MKAKTIFLALAMIMAVFNAQAQTQDAKLIDFDYTKAIPFALAGFDYNLNGNVDDDEIAKYREGGMFYMVYKDHETDGSAITFEISFNSQGEEGKLMLRGTLEDAKLYRYTKHGEYMSYICENKLGENQFNIIIDADGGPTVVWVTNWLVLEKIE